MIGSSMIISLPLDETMHSLQFGILRMPFFMKLIYEETLKEKCNIVYFALKMW